MTNKLLWILLAASISTTGCQSQLATVYGVASGRTTVADVVPPEARPSLRRERGAETVAQNPLTAPPAVTPTAFAPPPGPTAPTSVYTPSAPADDVTARRDPLPEPTEAEAMALVMADVQQLGQENPAAQSELLRQLQAAQPGHWPLIAKRFRADLAYHEQLKQGQEPEMMVATRPAPPQPQTSQPQTSPPPSSRSQAAPAAHFAPPPVEVPASRPVAGSAEGSTTRHAPPAATPMSLPDSVPAAYAPTSEWSPPAETNNAARNTASRIVAYTDEPESAQVKPAVATMTHQPAPAVREPLPVPPAAVDWQAALSQAITALESQAPQDPHTTEEAYRHARVRLMALAAGDLDRAVTPIPGLSASEQDYWSKQLFAVSTMLDAASQPESNRRAAAAALHLGMAQAKLQQIGSLTVRNLRFCDEVFAYGGYKQRRTRRFQPGEEATLYLEVENFRTEETDDGYHTAIGTSYRVLDASGNRVDSREFPTVDDYCLSRRRDFYIQYGITLPERVYPGEYQLELTLTDELGNKIGKASIDFEIVEPTE
ncbi:MAG: hypothetical protein AAF589_02870 [Planctomycetota bacterium]